MIKLALVAGALLAVVHVTGQPETTEPAQPFWQQQGAAPAAREAEGIEALRSASRQDALPVTMVAAR